TYIWFFLSSRRRHTRSKRDWSSDVCSSDLGLDRSYLIQTALSTSAVAADSPLHPNFSQSFGETVKTRDTDGAKKLLTDAGLLSRSEERRVGKESGARSATERRIPRSRDWRR